MPLPDLGKTAGVLGGGGPAQGLPQIIQINEFLNAGVKFHYLNATSVAAWNVLNPRQAYEIWKDDINSEADVWDLDLHSKAVVRSVFKNIPHEPFRHPVKFLKFVARALANIPEIPWDLDPAPGNLSRLSPLAEKFVTVARMYGLDAMDGYLDLSPLVKKLRERVDLSDFWKQDTKVHILVRSVENGDIYVFSNKREDCEKNSHFLYIDSENTVFKVAQAACALRNIFPPVNINGHDYCDSGPVNPFPVEYAFDEGCDTIFCFIKDFSRYARSKNFLERLVEDDNAAMRDRYQEKKKQVDIRKRQEGQKSYEIFSKYPLHPDLGLLSLSPAAKKHTFPVESEATREWLKENLGIEY